MSFIFQSTIHHTLSDALKALVEQDVEDLSYVELVELDAKDAAECYIDNTYGNEPTIRLTRETAMLYSPAEGKRIVLDDGRLLDERDGEVDWSEMAHECLIITEERLAEAYQQMLTNRQKEGE